LVASNIGKLGKAIYGEPDSDLEKEEKNLLSIRIGSFMGWEEKIVIWLILPVAYA
jgi:hypothetical protein